MRNKNMFQDISFKIFQHTIFVILILIIPLTSGFQYSPFPSGPINITQLANYSRPNLTERIEISGGNHTILKLDATSQSYNWNVFIGNISAFLAIGDFSNNTLFKWDVKIVSGELYATRDNETFDWSNVSCANVSQIYDEQMLLNIDNSDTDSINNTFNKKLHRSFITSSNYFAENECLSVRINKEGGTIDTYFEEALLYTGNKLLYAGLLDNGKEGYDGNKYDFEFILPNSQLTESTVYYFYIELT